MGKKTIPKKKPTNETAQAEPENSKGYNGDYTGYFYKNIDRLWDAIMHLQEENRQLKAQVKGEY